MTSHKIAQSRINQRNSEKKLIKLIRDNFTENDVALTLTYIITPENVDEAQRRLSNFLRRIKRLRAKQGLEPLKYVTVTEAEMCNGRIWHRVIMNAGLDVDVLRKLWRIGFIEVQRLRLGENGVTLATYIVKDRQTYRRWNSSRNLIFSR